MALKQANLFPVDVESIWDEFRSASHWDAGAAKDREDVLKKRLGELRARQEKIAAELEAAEKELASLSDRDRKAKAHLEAAAKGMGRFASPAVLMASLLEAFPPLKPKRGRPPKTASAGRPISTPASEADSDELPVDNEVRASMLRSFVLDTMDSEGMKVSDLHTRVPKGTDFTYGELSTIVRQMVDEQVLRSLGGRGKGCLFAKPEPTNG